MKYSVRVHGGTHDTIWDDARIQDGWLVCKNRRDVNDDDIKTALLTLDAAFLFPVADERWYPPTSIYSVRPIQPPEVLIGIDATPGSE